MEDKTPSKAKSADLWITTGVVGALASSLCCITPLAVILLGVAGLGAWTGYIDYVVLPSLAASIGLLGYGFYSKKRCENRNEKGRWESTQSWNRPYVARSADLKKPKPCLLIPVRSCITAKSA
jgi:mercuric ion transport protein